MCDDRRRSQAFAPLKAGDGSLPNFERSDRESRLIHGAFETPQNTTNAYSGSDAIRLIEDLFAIGGGVFPSCKTVVC
jgi:hypothetical protein